MCSLDDIVTKNKYKLDTLDIEDIDKLSISDLIKLKAVLLYEKNNFENKELISLDEKRINVFIDINLDLVKDILKEKKKTKKTLLTLLKQDDLCDDETLNIMLSAL